MVKELGKYQKDEKTRKQGAKQALDNFTKARIEFVAANAVVSGYNILFSCFLIPLQNARKYYNWASNSAEKLEEDKRDRKNKRYQACVSLISRSKSRRASDTNRTDGTSVSRRASWSWDISRKISNASVQCRL